MLRSFAGGLFGELWGTSPPVVIGLHGWRRTHADFARVLGPDSEGGSLPSVAPDLPGFGATPAPDATWGSVDYANAVAGLIACAEGTDGPAVVLGHSLGGRVAATLAANRPDLVRALVLTGAPLMAHTSARSRPPIAFRATRRLHRLGLVGEERLERAKQSHGSEDYRNARGVMRDILVRLTNESYDEVLARVRCPVELVWGADDNEVPLSVAHGIAERLTRSNLTVCPGAGHLLPLERPAELRIAVERAMHLDVGDEKNGRSPGGAASGTRG